MSSLDRSEKREALSLDRVERLRCEKAGSRESPGQRVLGNTGQRMKRRENDENAETIEAYGSLNSR